MMPTSTAVIFHAPGQDLELRSVPTPAPRGAEILVRVLGCTLCGSDLHSVDGRRGTPVPTVLGHEIVGVIEAFGDTAPREDLSGAPLVPGDRITWSIAASCGQCFYCTRGLPQKCTTVRKYGHEALRPGYELLGGLAEHCLLLEGTAAVKLPESLPLAVACPASCATATVAAALRAAGEVRGRTAAVFGMGMLGLTAAAMLAAQGASAVVCVDVNEHRLARAGDFGATHRATPDTFEDAVRGATGGHGVDMALELSGSASAYLQGWSGLRTGGTMVLVGSVFPAPPVALSLEQVVRRNLTLRGVHNYAPADLLAAVRFLSAHHGQFPFESLVARWYDLQEVAPAFIAGRNPEYIRIGVRPSVS